ncbi:hypothetical protein Hdeb2414_s0001g00011951 [Helianthus debilis subsp. tardiflorus]
MCNEDVVVVLEILIVLQRLHNIFDASNSSFNTEVLVGTGSKTMKIIKIKSLVIT